MERVVELAGCLLGSAEVCGSSASRREEQSMTAWQLLPVCAVLYLVPQTQCAGSLCAGCSTGACWSILVNSRFQY